MFNRENVFTILIVSVICGLALLYTQHQDGIKDPSQARKHLKGKSKTHQHQSGILVSGGSPTGRWQDEFLNEVKKLRSSMLDLEGKLSAEKKKNKALLATAVATDKQEEGDQGPQRKKSSYKKNNKKKTDDLPEDVTAGEMPPEDDGAPPLLPPGQSSKAYDYNRPSTAPTSLRSIIARAFLPQSLKSTGTQGKTFEQMYEELVAQDPIEPGASIQEARGFFLDDQVSSGECGFKDVPASGWGTEFKGKRTSGADEGNLHSTGSRKWPNDRDGKEFELETCTNRRMVYCNNPDVAEQLKKSNSKKDAAPLFAPPQPEGNGLQRKGKALMMYMIHHWDVDDRPAEWSNLVHLWQFGLHPSTEGTQMFDGIDYIFYRPNSNVKDVELCLEYKNIKLYWIPDVPCDLCAHRKLLHHIGFKPSYSQKVPKYSEWPYKQLILVNSGVRGPLQGPHNSHWLDVLAMAGQRRRSLFWEDSLKFKTLGAATISWEQRPHAQSYFLSVPLAGMDYYFDRFTVACNGNKIGCIMNAEVRSLDPLLWDRKDWNAYSFVQNFTTDHSQIRHHHKRMYNIRQNPTYGYTDPCQGLFMKFGGGAWQFQPIGSRRSTLHVTRHMHLLSRRDTGSRAKMVQMMLNGEGHCRFFRMSGRGSLYLTGKIPKRRR